MKRLIKVIALVVMFVCFLLPVAECAQVWPFELLETPETTHESHVVIRFTGEPGISYTLYHKHRSVWRQPETMKLEQAEGEFSIELSEGANDFVLREAGQPRDALGGINFSIIYTPAPKETPTPAPTEAPTAPPTKTPTAPPTKTPTAPPTEAPTAPPTEAPTPAPTEAPTAPPTEAPTAPPTPEPMVTSMTSRVVAMPTAVEALGNTLTVMITPSPSPTASPSPVPTATPMAKPAVVPTQEPTEASTPEPTPIQEPTVTPTPKPAVTPTVKPTATPTPTPMVTLTPEPTTTPTATPTPTPMVTLTPVPTATPIATPKFTILPTPEPTEMPAETLEPEAAEGVHRTLTLWAIGDDVTALQEGLTNLGFKLGRVDGVYGPRTRNAVSRFQRKYKLKVDGVLGAQTREKLAELGVEIPLYVEPDRTMPEGFERELSYGMRGMDVRALQEKLIERGYLEGKPDHVYGKKTRTAVRTFQREMGLKADGIAGPATLRALFAEKTE